MSTQKDCNNIKLYKSHAQGESAFMQPYRHANKQQSLFKTINKATMVRSSELLVQNGLYWKIPKSYLCIIFPKFQGAISIRKSITKPTPSSENLALGWCPWWSSFPTMLPSSEQVLPVTRTEEREKADEVGPVLCPTPVPTPSRQPGSSHPHPALYLREHLSY